MENYHRAKNYKVKPKQNQENLHTSTLGKGKRKENFKNQDGFQNESLKITIFTGFFLLETGSHYVGSGCPGTQYV